MRSTCKKGRTWTGICRSSEMKARLILKEEEKKKAKNQ